MQIGAPVQVPLRYEFPLTERVRLLLRLEDSFQRVRDQAGETTPDAHRYALMALCELVELASRIDIKSEVRIEAERQRTLLRGFRNLAGIDPATLEDVLAEVDHIVGCIDSSPQRAGSRCRDDAWLTMVRTRMALPGGVTRFDMPSFNFWSAKDPTWRRERLLEWLDDFQCIAGGVATLLRLLRGSAETASQRAVGGQFQGAVAMRQPLLVVVDTAPDADFIPEVSANRSTLLVRFMCLNASGRPRPCEDDVAFGLAVTYAN